MSNKLLNILLTAFIIICPTASYLLNYSSCYSLDLRQNAFYFYLLLIAVFMLFFLFICCYGNAFSRPVFVKNSFMLLTIIFLPLFCHYVAKHYFYKVYLSPLIYILIFLCLIIGFIRLPDKKPQKSKFSFVSFVSIFIIIYPLLFYLYKLPKIYQFDMTSEVLSFTIGTIAIFGMIYVIFFAGKNNQFTSKLYSLICLFAIPLLLFYVYKYHLFATFNMLIFFLLFIILILGYFYDKLSEKDSSN